ncbi:MAG TPA: glycosyl hydrolase, partial [Puia sp.]|nr:glycosyl hydrolase [Puia sp.]
SGRALIADGMEVKRKSAVPMSAMWTPSAMNGFNQTGYQLDIRESASVAHIYGQNVVAAESFTAFGPGGNAWSYSPENLKPTADLELASGLNRFVIHTSVHQPTDDKIPGLGPFGQWFNRHETWAEQAKVWTTYLARSSYMLQQGKFIADVIYYYGEDNNITSLFGNRLPGIPEGYNYDFVNADALLNMLAVNKGQIVTATGMQYKLLALDSNSMQMTLEVARKIRDLVKSGAIIVGPKPRNTPSLSDNKAEWNAIINELWGADNTVRSVGKGQVYNGQSIQAVLNILKIAKDFDYSKPQSNSKLMYVHRRLGQQEFYWIINRNNQVENLETIFRVTGKTVEIWHPETGTTEIASYSFDNEQTKVPLHLEPTDAVFVVFKPNATKSSFRVLNPVEKELFTLEGNWNIKFQPYRGAPASAQFDKLISWSESKDTGIKYFSGTATYTKTVTAKADWFQKGAQVLLDLGDVKNIAEVKVNGQLVGTVWKKPYRIDITKALKPGNNELAIGVTNLWVNRLIGDRQPGAGDKKITYTTMPFYLANSKLLPSGLLGPVRILSLK